LCDKCAAEGLARVFGKDACRWYFSTDAYDYQHAYEADQKFLEYAEQYEILNSINPGKFGAEWVKKVVEGGRVAQVVTLEESLELLRIAKEANEGESLICLNMTCICKRTRGGDVTEPICMFFIHPPKEEHAREMFASRIFSSGERESFYFYDPVDLDKMKELLLDYEKRLGLVHTVFTIGFPSIITLCNCEMPYCHSMRQRLLYGVEDAFVEGYYVARINNDKCIGCGECERQCQFGAIRLDRKLEKVVHMPTNCFGCGICRSVCPADAIEMVERETVTLLPKKEPYGVHHPIALHEESVQ